MPRPAASDFAFRLYDRAVHPELFAAAATATVERPGYRAELSLGEAGHRVTLRAGGRTFTEVLAPADFDLPAGGLRVGRAVDGAGLEEVVLEDAAWGSGVLRYRAGHQAETPPAGVFANITAELLADAAATATLAEGRREEVPGEVRRTAAPGQLARAAAVAARFGSRGRLAGDSVGLIRVDPGPDSLLVHAFHTFADTRTVVRTQALWEWE